MGAVERVDTSEEERNWAMAAHLGSFLTAYIALGLLAPLAVLLFKGNNSSFIRRHAVESLNFQITTLIAIGIGVVLIFLVVGIFILIAWGIFYLIVVILGGVKASRGEDYRYPLTLRFVS